MISRIDSPAQANFTKNAENLYPYEAKVSRPVSVLQYADTVYSVRSNGLTATWYKNASGWSAGNIAYTGNMPICKMWWGNGYPEVFTDLTSLADTWGFILKGYFKPTLTGTHKFYFGGQGTISKCAVNSVDLVTADKNITENDISLSSSNATASLTAGTWYSIEIRYSRNKSLGNNSGLVVLYKNTSASDVFPHKIILSAGVTAPDGASPSNNQMPIALTNKTMFNNIKLSNNPEEIPTFSFEVPLVSSSNYAGYKYQQSTDSYVNVADAADVLKKYRMVVYNQGYKVSTAETVTKFTGQIRDFKVGLNKEGNDVLEITCYGYEIFTKDHFNYDSPNTMDYISNEYIQNISGRYNGLTKPRTFDGWEIYRILETILVNSFIDPSLFTYRKTYSDYYSNVISGPYYIEQLTKTEKLFTSTKLNYGKPLVVKGSLQSPDDSYLYKIDTGTYWYDIATELMNTYGYKWGLNRYGYVYLSEPSVPSGYKNNTDFAFSAGWSNILNINSFKATRSDTQSLTATCSATCRASRITLLCFTGPTYGSNMPSWNNIKVTVLRGATTVSTARYNTYSANNHGYYDVSDSSGVNPSAILIATGLPYDTYRVKLEHLTANYKIGLEGLLYWDYDYLTPKVVMYTGEATGVKGTVSELDIENTGFDLRNECIVLGARSGTKVGKKEDGEIDVVNPNNPIYIFINSATRDLNSIYSSTAQNFVGRPMTTLIYEPTILSQDQADYVSFNTVRKYRLAKPVPSAKIVGNPLLECGDIVALVDVYKNTINKSRNLWIDSMDANISDKYELDLKLSPYEPAEGYFKKPMPTMSDIGNAPVQNISIINRGRKSCLTSAITTASTNLPVNSTLGAPSQGYVKTYVFLPDGYGYPGIWETMKYTRLSATAYGGIINNYRGLQGTTPRPFLINTTVYAGWDPYTADSMGINPIISFDLFRTGRLMLWLSARDEQNNMLYATAKVDVLTGLQEETWPDGIGHDFLIWGANYMRTFGGYDNYGYWNNMMDKEVAENATGFVSEPPCRKANGLTTTTSPFGPIVSIDVKFSFIDEETNQTYNVNYSTGAGTRIWLQRGEVGTIYSEYTKHIRYWYSNPNSYLRVRGDDNWPIRFPQFATSSWNYNTATGADSEIFREVGPYSQNHETYMQACFHVGTALTFKILDQRKTATAFGAHHETIFTGRTTDDGARDPHYCRFYSPNLKIMHRCLIGHHTMFYHQWSVYGPLESDPIDFLVNEEARWDFYNNGNGMTLNWWPEYNNIIYDDGNWTGYRQYYTESADETMLFKHIFLIYGSIIDQSGRKVSLHPEGAIYTDISNLRSADPPPGHAQRSRRASRGGAPQSQRYIRNTRWTHFTDNKLKILFCSPTEHGGGDEWTFNNNDKERFCNLMGSWEHYMTAQNINYGN